MTWIPGLPTSEGLFWVIEDSKYTSGPTIEFMEVVECNDGLRAWVVSSDYLCPLTKMGITHHQSAQKPELP